ncbi:DUF6064 family protein [Ramlibacter solisilvae]|uniref:DUF6064 family protein n=1 Tax=Ramlibacter tataouinensis TaxID=94132 RepID=UPI000777BB90|nr:DUF6064 family protein [Ramlibacter tataouinensis]
MSEWWTYRLSDFLMFSPQAYGRLVETYNQQLWPGPLAAGLLGVVALALAMRGGVGAGRALMALLALAWFWVAWAFLTQHYATIFLAAPHLALAFEIQALLFALLACAPVTRSAPTSRLARRTGMGLAVLGLLGYPLLAPALGRPWSQAEVFGWMPDPTALVSLGLLLASGLRLARVPRWLLMVVPALALVFGAATQWELWKR